MKWKNKETLSHTKRTVEIPGKSEKILGGRMKDGMYPKGHWNQKLNIYWRIIDYIIVGQQLKYWSFPVVEPHLTCHSELNCFCSGCNWCVFQPIPRIPGLMPLPARVRYSWFRSSNAKWTIERKHERLWSANVWTSHLQCYLSPVCFSSAHHVWMQWREELFSWWETGIKVLTLECENQGCLGRQLCWNAPSFLYVSMWCSM